VVRVLAGELVDEAGMLRHVPFRMKGHGLRAVPQRRELGLGLGLEIDLAARYCGLDRVHPEIIV
jgi:hypothetical protein